MSSKVWEKIHAAIQLCEDHRDKTCVLTSWPPQYHFNKGITVEQVIQRIYEIGQAYSEEKTMIAKSPVTTVCKPLVSYLESYQEHGGNISSTLMDGVLGYCSEIETNYQRMREHEAQMYAAYKELEKTVEEYIS